MDDVLEQIILSRLGEDAGLDELTRDVVIAACRGDDELAGALRGETSGPTREARTRSASVRKPAYLQNITVEGFRGIGPRASLEITPGPGLTLVVGRNGSGKSSFAEALELLLTGDNSRWSTRSAVWKEGWRNLHNSIARIDAEFVVEGDRGITKVVRHWEPDAKLEDGDTAVQLSGSKEFDLEGIGWADSVEMYRPFLSYSELGSMLDAGPSALYDALSSILGLEELVGAESRLKEAIRVRRKLIDEAKTSMAPLVERLQSMEDERASVCLQALSEPTWDLDSIENTVLGSVTAEQEESELVVLRQLSLLEPPDPAEVQAAAEALQQGAESLREIGGTEAEKARQTADLLDAALHFHESHGDQDCPICGQGALDGSWREATASEVRRLRELAEKAELAHRLMNAVIENAHGLLIPPPPVLSAAGGVGLQAEDVVSAWKTWTAGTSIEDAEELVGHLNSSVTTLTSAISELRAKAERELERREDIWRPVAAEIVAWLEVAKQAKPAEGELDRLRGAEKWLRSASADIRNERFAPIADSAESVWDMLRMQSSVELKKIVLTGTGTARKVVLEVTVDGMAGAALGVMSQGELNSLALSLFMPRATLQESPFRFIVIDDPVQSMDPSRVDGLARVLQKAAESRQVLVFTHDERLPRSCRLLGIDAKVVEVTRRANSTVEVRPGADPVSRHCSDAWAIAKSEDIDPAVRARIVGVFCRSAIEAACTEAITRRQLADGRSYEEIEELLDSAKGLAQLMALALFKDISRTKDISASLERGIGRWASAAYRRVQEAAHNPVKQESLLALVEESEKLARGLVQLP